MDEVYHFAADRGGIGYVTGTHAPIARNNMLTNHLMLDVAVGRGVDRFLLSTSGPGYGPEKFYMEEFWTYYREDYGLQTRAVRFYNVYGPLGAYEGGKEKAPAALCRKVARAEDGGTLTVRGDGWKTC